MYNNFQKDADELQALIMEDAKKVYSEKVIERWLNPKNLGRIRNPEVYWGAEKQIIIDSIREQKKFLVQIPRGVKPGTLLRVVLNESKDEEILLRVRII